MRSAPQVQLAGLRALWFLAVPAGLALLATRYMFPTPAEAAAGWTPLARIVEEHPLALAAGLFVLASALLRYWRRYLPGGRTLLAPPAGLPAEGDRVRRTLSFAATVAAAALAGLLLRARVVETFHVTSSSMVPTLGTGDEVIASKLAYVGKRLPARGDVIVFRRTRRLEAAGPGELIKRVVGLPGDLIAIDQGRLVINGSRVPHCDAGTYPLLAADEMTLGRLDVEFLGDRAYLIFMTPFARPFAPYRVAPGEVFVLGDNRNNSADSRVWNDGRGGGVPLAAIEGRVTRLLAARGRDGRIDLHTLLRPLGRDLRLPGMDARILEAGIERCLQTRPSSTWPPS